MRYYSLLFASAFSMVAAAALADNVSLVIDNFYIERQFSNAIVKVTNNTDRHISLAIVECAFLDADGRSVGVGLAGVSNIAPGASGYDTAGITRSDGVSKVNCRVRSVMD